MNTNVVMIVYYKCKTSVSHKVSFTLGSMFLVCILKISVYLTLC